MDKFRGEVKQYTYRTAVVTEPFLVVPRNTVKELEHTLAQKAGVEPDNHTVYEIRQTAVVTADDVPPTFIGFSDDRATFGHSVFDRRW